MSRQPGSAPSQKPRDGPALSFEADPHIEKLLPLWRARMGRSDTDVLKDEVRSPIGSEFGLVLVAGWPPKLDVLGSPYAALVDSVQKCFEEEDLIETDRSSSPGPAVYIYPAQHLHVTVATLHAFTVGTKSDDERDTLLRHWKKIVLDASKRNEWPREKLKIQISSAQIGSKAGILLWRETTGGLEMMRKCVADETEERRAELGTAGVDAGSLSIPPIVHSTFLRFDRVPATKGEFVQAKFQDLVLSRLKETFSDEVEMNSAALVCERMPYMHIPYDEHHVLAAFPLV